MPAEPPRPRRAARPARRRAALPDALADLLAAARTHHVLTGDARKALAPVPDGAVDLCLTSPPYFSQRRYAAPGLGDATTPDEWLDGLMAILREVRRVLSPRGSLWLNLGDAYRNKRLLGLPWRAAFRLMDDEGWALRNDVIWNKIKGGPDASRDRLRNVHEHVFHLVRDPSDYYYDADAVRSAPRSARVVGGAVVSATGVSGVRYRRQIELSTALSGEEKERAYAALEDMLAAVGAGKLSDFRMILRGRQRATHSDATAVSGRARELAQRGFYFLRYHPRGSKPGDVWDILPEDERVDVGHFAPFPRDLCRIPVLACCPPGGLVLDPFAGTATAGVVALEHGRRFLGVEVAESYVEAARRRLAGAKPRPVG